MWLRALIACAACAASIITPAQAGYLDEYKLYSAAFEAGDIAGALKHGKAAWRAAETELGDHATTAILAFNFANLIAPISASLALEAYERALAITQKQIGSLSIAELEFDIAIMKLSLDLDNKKTVMLAEALLNARRESNAAPSEISAIGWNLLARQKLNANRFQSARDYADFAAAESEALMPPNELSLAVGLTLGGVARLAGGGRRTREDYLEAVLRFDRAISLFPPQIDIDHFHPMLATAIVWRASAWAGAATERNSSALKQLKDVRARAEDQIKWLSGRPERCGLEWARQSQPNFPEKPLNQGLVGSALIGYDVSGQNVERAIVLAYVSDPALGEAGIDAIKTWTLKEPAPEQCQKNNTILFNYVILYAP